MSLTLFAKNLSSSAICGGDIVEFIGDTIGIIGLTKIKYEECITLIINWGCVDLTY